MDIVKMGKFLKELRKEKGLTQEQLGEKIGVTNKTDSRWENGNYSSLPRYGELYHQGFLRKGCRNFRRGSGKLP